MTKLETKKNRKDIKLTPSEEKSAFYIRGEFADAGIHNISNRVIRAARRDYLRYSDPAEQHDALKQLVLNSAAWLRNLR